MVKGKIINKQIMNLRDGDSLIVTVPNSEEVWYTIIASEPMRVTITKREHGTVVDIYPRDEIAS